MYGIKRNQKKSKEIKKNLPLIIFNNLQYKNNKFLKTTNILQLL